MEKREGMLGNFFEFRTGFLWLCSGVCSRTVGIVVIRNELIVKKKKKKEKEN